MADFAAWTLFRPDRALIKSANIALAVTVVCFVITRLPLGLTQESLYDALIYESLAIWLILLGFGVALRRFPQAQPEAY